MLPNFNCSTHISCWHKWATGTKVSAEEWDKMRSGKGKEERGVGWGLEIGANRQRITSETGESGKEGLWALLPFWTLTWLLLLAKIHRKSVCLMPISDLAHAQSESLLFLFVTTLTQQAEISELNIKVQPFNEPCWNQKAQYDRITASFRAKTKRIRGFNEIL